MINYFFLMLYYKKHSKKQYIINTIILFLIHYWNLKQKINIIKEELDIQIIQYFFLLKCNLLHNNYIIIGIFILS